MTYYITFSVNVEYPFLINLVFLLLDWLFYNSKSSIPNGSASPFKRRNKKLLVRFFVILSEFPTPPLQWPDLVLATALVPTPHWSSTLTMSLLNKLQELWLIAVACVLLLFFPFALTASSAAYSRASTNKPSSSYQKILQTTPENLIRSSNFGSSGALKETLQIKWHW